MHISDQIIHCVAFLGMKTERGFYAYGTSFFIQIIEDSVVFVYAVTASHVINDAAADTVSMRVQRRPGMSPKIFETHKSEWIGHPDYDIDICVYPIDRKKWDAEDDLYVVALTVPGMVMTPEEEERYGFGIGSDIFIPSAFTAALGEKQNTPVVRFGHIAAMAIEPIAFASPKRPAFLIETRSLGDMSGSPIIFHIDPARKGRRKPFRLEADTGLQITPYFLVGMLKGSWSGQYKDDFVMNDNITTDAEFNSGLSIVLPAVDILEVLYQANLIHQRRETIERLQIERI